MFGINSGLMLYGVSLMSLALKMSKTVSSDLLTNLNFGKYCKFGCY